MKQAVSFIMPAYNCAKTVEQSVESIISGNFIKGDEIVIVDDCSTDDTYKVLERTKKKHSKIPITLVKHSFNKGGAAARNTAVENSKNDLIFCLDSDNILEEASIIRLKAFLKSENADVVAFEKLAYFKDDPTKVTHYWVFPTDEKLDFEYYLSHNQNPGASGNYLFTRNSWMKAGRYPEGSGALDAWGFGIRQVATGSLVRILPNSQYFHRYGYDSYWVRDAKSGKTSLTALQILVPFIDQLNKRDVDYIFSRKHRLNWLGNLEKKPIRLKKERGLSMKRYII